MTFVTIKALQEIKSLEETTWYLLLYNIVLPCI